MGQLNILIVEDEPIIAADLEMHLEMLGYNVADIFESGEEAIEYLKGHSPDIILMDIQLDGELDGIDTAHQILKKQDIPIIFLTSNTDQRTFTRAKLTRPNAFLSKPFRVADIAHSIDLAIMGNENVEVSAVVHPSYHITEDRIFVRDKLFLQKVMIRDILYIEADSNYSKIITNEKKIVISQTLKKIQENIKDKTLVRVHRSFIVNIHKVDKISDGYIHIGEKSIPVGRSYKEEVHAGFNML